MRSSIFSQAVSLDLLAEVVEGSTSVGRLLLKDTELVSVMHKVVLVPCVVGILISLSCLAWFQSTEDCFEYLHRYSSTCPFKVVWGILFPLSFSQF